MIVHLNGWPGAGKQTIGAQLSRKLAARFIHNHLLHDVAIVCAGLGTPLRWRLYESVRSAAYEALAQLPPSKTFVMTNAPCNGDPREEMAWGHVVELAIARHVPLVPIVVELSFEENVRRLQSPGRVGRKMTDPSLLTECYEKFTIQRPDVPELLLLDVSALSPEQAAIAIAEHLDHVRPALRPATLQHLRLRQ